MHLFYFPSKREFKSFFSAVTGFKAAAWLPVMSFSGGTLSLAWTMSNESAIWSTPESTTVSTCASPSCAGYIHYVHSLSLQCYLQTCESKISCSASFVIGSTARSKQISPCKRTLSQTESIAPSDDVIEHQNPELLSGTSITGISSIIRLG